MIPQDNVHKPRELSRCTFMMIYQNPVAHHNIHSPTSVFFWRGGAFLVNGTQQCFQGKATGGGGRGRYRCRTSAGSSSGNHRGSSSYRRLAPPSAHTCRLAVNSFATEQTLLSAKKKKSSCARADDDDDDALNLDHNPCCCRRFFFFFFFRFLFLRQNSKRTKRRRNKQKI